MDCQIGRRQRNAEWDEIEEAPQVKRIREDVKPESQPQQAQQTVQNQAAPVQIQQQQQQAAPQEPPKFYISAPIQGYSSDNQGGCRYLFF